MTNQEFTANMATLENLHYSFALRLTRSRQDAEDLVQETTLKAFRNIEKFTPGTNFKNWTATIMRNTFINNYRKMKTRRHINQSVEELSNVIENKNVINNSGEQNMRMEELKQMMDSIRDIYSVPFMMFFQGYEYKEIARDLNIPIGTVKSRIFLARQKMKAMIGSRIAA
ncbi:hypothetical protein CEQ90_16530 [Lewinellaceae bacterium SD302]|nr:hypothetical protein CEQ90_16530 [Lewinellaceae bacterium SD302]